MITLPATEARKHLGQFMSKAQQEPVMITRPGQEPVIMISKKEFDYLETLDGAYWYTKAMEAKKGGMASPEEVDKLFERYFNEEPKLEQTFSKVSRFPGCQTIQTSS